MNYIEAWLDLNAWAFLQAWYWPINSYMLKEQWKEFLGQQFSPNFNICKPF